MISIREKIYPSIANINIYETCNIEPVSLWIIFNASILDRIRPVKTGKQRAHKLFNALCEYKLLHPRAEGQELETTYINMIILLAFYKLINKAIAL
tara:strand:- start:72 stop:359 length:288 start_codon:yes stop_codon:yes gene_type:complete